MIRKSIHDEEAARREMEAVFADIDAHPWPIGIQEARDLYDAMGPPIADDISTERFEIGGIQARMLRPPEFDPERSVLFLHGGGYVYGSLQSHGGMVAEIARASQCAALQIDYRLAPEHPFPAALEDACRSYEWLIQRGFAPHKIALAGDSAGGGLVVATLIALKALGRPLPGAAVCISPWVDLQQTGESYHTRQTLDPIVERDLAKLLAGLYLNGQDPTAHTASPIHADLGGLPPLLIQVGEREVLFSDAELLALKAKSSSVDVTFQEWPGMIHVWHLYFPMLTAGREAIADAGAFVVEKTAAKAVRKGIES